MNSSGINPTGHMVLVKYPEAEGATKGGIILPPSRVDRDQHSCQVGTLVAKGPTAGDFTVWPEGHEFPVVGSRVVVKKFASQYDMKGDDGFDYRLCEDKDILAVLGG